MFARSALVLATLALLAGCGTTPTLAPAQSALAGRVAAAGIGFDHMEIEYSYKLGSKAAKQFLAKAPDLAKSTGATCTLKEDGGFFGTTIKVKLSGTMQGVTDARKELDALYKSLK